MSMVGFLMVNLVRYMLVLTVVPSNRVGSMICQTHGKMWSNESSLHSSLRQIYSWTTYEESVRL